MSFYTEEQLKSLGFAKLGKNVKLSDKASLYGINRIEIDDNARIDDFCIISAGEKGIKIGKFVHISCYTSLIGKEKIEICDFAGVSSHSSVYSSSDDFNGGAMAHPTIPEKFRNVTNQPVYIGKNSIVGAHCCILPGVKIGDGASIGACSLVNKNIKDGMIAYGIPCKEIKERKKDYIELEKKFLKEAGY